MALTALGRFRRIFILLAVVVWPSLCGAQSLAVRIDGEQMRVAAQGVHFLTGESLRRLHDGISVNYTLKLTAAPARSGTAAGATGAVYRFTISYDLWEEKFAVTRIEPAPRSISHLSIAAAEAACLENLVFPIPPLSPDTPFWVRLEYQADETTAVSASNESGISLANMIDIFSGRKPKEPARGTVESPALRLSDLRKANAPRGSGAR